MQNKQFFSKYIVYVIPAIMLFFFARNIVLSNTAHLDAWMGGGMQMFSSIDKTLYRVAGFTTELNGKTHFVNLRNVTGFEKLDMYGRVMPSEPRLKYMVRRIESERWCYDTETNQIDVCEGSLHSPTPIPDLKVKSVKVFRSSFNRDTKVVSLALINEFSVQK
jgi:hypothetical protein